MVLITALPDGLSRRERTELEHSCGWALLRSGMIRLGLCGPGMTVEDIMGLALKGGHGKPYLPEGPEFSISHSHGLAACAIESVPVGLDIERVREFSVGMTEKICTEGELLLANGNKSLLTQLWTCKESHMKLTGRGFSQGLRETEFCDLGGCPRMVGDRGASFYSACLEHAGQEFWLTLCAGGPVEFRTEWTNYDDL